MRILRSTAIFAFALSAAGALGHVTLAQEGTAGRSGQSEASLAPGTPVYAELNSGLDSKKVKVGDAVSAHTTEAVKSADGRTILPRGTKLIGRVAQSTARSKGDGQSMLGIAFDKAVLKNGEDVPLYGRIQAIAAPVSFSGGDLSASPSPSNTGTTQTSPMSGNRTPQAPSATADPAVIRGGLPDGGEPAQQGLSPNSRGVIGLRGLTLATAPIDNVLVSTISSDGKNVHLDSGTRLLLVTQASLAEGPAQ
jgi:hypothetical protein